MQKQQVIETALRTFRLQGESILELGERLGDDFYRAVERIASGTGRLVVSGIGKSAIVGQKISATLNSTGTPSLFMHAADAIHGDLGMVQKDDIVLLISKSGDSPEIKVLVPLIRGFGNLIIALSGNADSYLVRQSDLFLDATVRHEACPNNLAPTTSTTAQMVIGDAMAVCLMEWRGFNPQDFARYHPGGSLGRRLYLRVSDVMAPQRPAVQVDTPVREVILEITRHRLGAAAVLASDGRLCGIVTDGDLRRMLERNEGLAGLTAQDVMGTGPRTISREALAAEALEQMRHHHINQLLVTAEDGYVGVIHIQDLIREGII